MLPLLLLLPVARLHRQLLVAESLYGKGLCHDLQAAWGQMLLLQRLQLGLLAGVYILDLAPPPLIPGDWLENL